MNNQYNTQDIFTGNGFPQPQGCMKPPGGFSNTGFGSR